MKTLNLLKPDIKTGYLEGGRGQEITYLQVPENISYKELEEDIENGAVQFRELLEFSKKKPSRFVVINCNNQEQGMAAVSYLSAIYNRLDKLTPDQEDGNDVEDEFEISFEDFDDDPMSIFDDDDPEEDDDWEEAACWNENPWKIPVISMSQLLENHDTFFSPFGSGVRSFGRVNNSRNRLPYWYYTRTENICIVHNMYSSLFGDVTKALKRYCNNRHVFIVAVAENNTFSDDLLCDDYTLDSDKSAFCEIILEYAAGTVKVACSHDELKEYHVTLFENWVNKSGYRLEKKFPTKKITANIVGMMNSSKSSLIEKVINYVIKDEDSARELTEKDFEILRQFKVLGADLTQREKKNTNKLKNDLVGMDAVKEQIMGIVNVMKYNKRRDSMGLGNSNFHNVHMLIGAPGTAKTTVAELLGNIMAEEKLLNGNRFISVNGAQLKGMYVGHSAPKVEALFNQYDIIFIDEAYAMAAGDNGEIDSFSQEAIAQLIIELEKHGMDRLVLFAGYGGTKVTEKDNKMKKFLESNPGIRSRINSTIYFDSYTADEMVKIFRCHAKQGKFNVNKKADVLIRDYFAKRVNERDFGNGREARSLLENSMVEAAKRLAKVPEAEITEKMLKEIKVEDIQNAITSMQKGMSMQVGRESVRLGFVS